MTHHIRIVPCTPPTTFTLQPLSKYPCIVFVCWHHFSSTQPHHKWRHDKPESGRRGWSQKMQAAANMVPCKYLYIRWRSSLFPNLNRVTPSFNCRPSATLHTINQSNLLSTTLISSTGFYHQHRSCPTLLVYPLQVSNHINNL